MKKNNIIYSIFLCVAFLFIGCEQQENVTFDAQNGQTLTNFVGSSSTQPVVIEGTSFTDIKVQVSTVSSSDRTIEVVADASSTATADQYTISNLVIPAGEYEGTIRVTGNYANIPVGTTFVLNLNLLGLSGVDDVSSNGAFKINLFRFCPVQIGVYTIDMHDIYGDGWQTTTASGGAGMTATLVDGAGAQTVIEFGMCSPYGGSNIGTFGASSDCTPGDRTDATTTITVPAGTVDIIWNFPGDRYGEIFFEITAPNGNEIYASGGPGDQAAGNLPPLIYCL